MKDILLLIVAAVAGIGTAVLVARKFRENCTP